MVSVLLYSCLVTQSAAHKQLSLRLPHSTRGCILYHLCCWCVWACRWSTAPLWQRSWESCSSTSTTAGLTSSSWSAPCPASSSFISPTSRHQRNTWPSDSLHLTWMWLLTPGVTLNLEFRDIQKSVFYMGYNYVDRLFLNQEWLIVSCKWWGTIGAHEETTLKVDSLELKYLQNKHHY